MNLLYLLQQTKISPQQRDFAAGLKTSFDDLYLVLNNLLNYVLLLTESANTHAEEIRMSTLLGSLQKVLLLKARQFNAEQKLNAYQKAKLGNAFKWKLHDMGHDAGLGDVMTKDLMFALR